MKQVTGGERKRSKMNKSTREFLAVLKELIDAQQDFWPLTVRRVFYAYIGRFGLRSERSTYQKVSDVLTRARLTGEVPWEAIEDRVRGLVSADGWTDSADFVTAHRDHVLKNYRRDLQQGQRQRLEVWIEKDALVTIAERAADPYTVPVAVARGFSSTTYRKEAADRIRANARGGQPTEILYFGDLDPSGAYMPVDIAETFFNDFGLRGLVRVWHCGLLPEHVAEHRLPTSPDAIKKGDSRTPWFRETYPRQRAVELDALEPQDFLELVRESVLAWLDEDEFEAQRAQEDAEAEAVADVREAVIAAFPQAS